MHPTHRERLSDLFHNLAEETYSVTISKGFDYNDQSQQMALFHSEISEAFEALRHDNPPSEHIPEYTALEEELADVVLRVMGFAYSHNLRLIEAMFAKSEFNRTRPEKHGGKLF